ncbi:MAG: PilN domain-containing protein [Myxococcaceae bacterium]
MSAVSRCSRLEVELAVILAIGGLVFPASAQQLDGGDSAIRAAVLRVVPKDVVPTKVEERTRGVQITGHANTHDAVAEFMRSLSFVVSTPRGIARIIELSAKRNTASVELLEVEGTAIVEFASTEVSRFGVELLRAESSGGKGGGVDFVLLVQAK